MFAGLETLVLGWAVGAKEWTADRIEDVKPLVDSVVQAPDTFAKARARFWVGRAIDDILESESVTMTLVQDQRAKGKALIDGKEKTLFFGMGNSQEIAFHLERFMGFRAGSLMETGLGLKSQRAGRWQVEQMQIDPNTFEVKLKTEAPL